MKFKGAFSEYKGTLADKKRAVCPDCCYRFIGGNNLFRTYLSEDNATLYLKCIKCNAIHQLKGQKDGQHTKSKNKSKV